jgi:hypothetical protein
VSQACSVTEEDGGDMDLGWRGVALVGETGVQQSDQTMGELNLEKMEW